MQPIMRQAEQFPDTTDHMRGQDKHENPWHHESSEDAFYYKPEQPFETLTDRESQAHFGATVHQAYGEPGSFYDGEEVRTKDKHQVVPNVKVEKVPGLYGEDEDHPYDVWATKNEHGGYDVIGEVGKYKHEKP